MVDTPNKGVENIHVDSDQGFSSILDGFERISLENDDQSSHLMDGNEGGEGSGEPTLSDPSQMTSAEARERRKNLGEFVSPSLAVNLADIVLSRLLGLGVGFIGIKATYKDFKLDADEKTTLKQPLADYLATLDFKMDTPLGNLMLCLSIVYGGKLIAAYTNNMGDAADVREVRRTTKEASKTASQIAGDESLRYDSKGKVKPAFLTPEQKRERRREKDRAAYAAKTGKIRMA